VKQSEFETRSIQDTLDLGWKLLHTIPRQELKRIRPEYLKKYYSQEEEEEELRIYYSEGEEEEEG
jgi:V/A-type H+-transporting ATPase subunit B